MAGLALSLLAARVRAEIEFIGLLATSQATHFALSDTATGRTEWVVRGNGFAGYTVSSYSDKGDTLLLRRDAETLTLRLKDDAKIKAARLELSGAITFGSAEQIDVERVTLLYDQDNVFPLKDNVTYRIHPRRLPDGTIRYAITIERILSENKIETVAAPNVVARPGQRFSIQMGDDLGFTFTPR